MVKGRFDLGKTHFTVQSPFSILAKEYRITGMINKHMAFIALIFRKEKYTIRPPACKVVVPKLFSAMTYLVLQDGS